MKSNALGIIAAVLGVSLALAFNSPSKYQTSYNHTTGTESWGGVGTPAADQNPLHYQPVKPNYQCLLPLNVVCTYIKDNMGVIRQNQPGVYN